ncbi:MAG: TIGR03087 family PEP-CTERM/XrtA system glycosyltransferase [Methylomonas sp.]|nr:TIGR03087 family PEP-CTERM/XrtA system glycosyltransferase [Methylomonas sp.]PPD19764.1 MAG: sugar transferase [Methylomonas sp.]PPD25587.1 MAG: sugar transferase [Methylomonas sp.]PPD36487.1 MAG: sugar transferase [Methylomonas sp.]PPD40964.1 MAG: sugar transferase [Methylomonas sp.]
MAKPKLLYLVHRIPYPPNKGDKIRSFNFLKALAERFDVYLGAFIDDPEDRVHVETLKAFCVEVFCLDLQPDVSKIKSLLGFCTGEALSLPYYRNAALQHWVDRVIADHAIDRALIFSSPMAQYLADKPAMRIVADFVDVDSDKWQQYAASKSWPMNWVYRREAAKLFEFERKMTGLFAQTLFVSEQESQLFQGMAPEYADKIGFVNNGVDTEFFDPSSALNSPYDSQEKAIVFTGAMDYWANVDAVLWFGQTVMPLIAAQDASARFYIVGSKPAHAVMQLAENHPAIVVTGRVDDVRPYVRHAHVAVGPLRIARGIQNKVLEAMAMARPVVVTPAGMEGIPESENLDVFVTDQPQHFADCVLRELRQPIRQSSRNRDYVMQHFGWLPNGQRLCDYLNA